MAAEQEKLLTGHVMVDGIEGKYARIELEDGSTEDWLLSSLPRGMKEGDVLRLHVEVGDLELEVDHTETKRRRHSAQAQLDALNRPAPSGELDL